MASEIMTGEQRQALIQKLNALWARRERVHMAASEREKVDAEIEGITNALRASPGIVSRKGANARPPEK